MALPPEKVKKLADKVADDVHKDLTRRRDDLVKHEVDKKQADQIVKDGVNNGYDRFRRDNP